MEQDTRVKMARFETVGGEPVYTLEHLFRDLGVAVAPGTKLQVISGQKIRLTATIDYMGPAVSATFYAALGSRGVFGFNEWAVGQKAVSFAQSVSWVTYTLTADIDTTGIANNTNLDLYCKLAEYPGAGMPEVDDVIDIIGAAPTFQNFKITDYSKV